MEKYDVIFYRKGKKYFFKYEGNEYKANNININNLNLVLKLPYIIKFYGLSRAQIGRILTSILDENMNFKLYKIKKEGSGVLEYVMHLYEKKNIIDAYMVPTNNAIYGRTNKINPYMLTKINQKNILMEVTKDYFKKNKGEYYFLAKDLTEKEKIAFDNYNRKIECDYIYNLSNYSEENNHKTKIR